MKEYSEFEEFYNICVSIIESYQKSCKNISNVEKIKLIRENLDKNTLNSYYNLGEIPQEIINSIECKITFLKFSIDNMIKNR